MKAVAVFLIAMIVCSSATSLFDKYPINFSSKRSIMTLLTQVESKLKLGGPLDSITRMLQDFVTEVTQEQVSHDDLIANNRRECATEENFRSNEIKAADAALSEGQATLDSCSSQQNRATQDLATTYNQLQENKAFLAIIEDTRVREAYNFATASEVYRQTSTAIDSALNLLE